MVFNRSLDHKNVRESERDREIQENERDDWDCGDVVGWMCSGDEMKI